MLDLSSTVEQSDLWQQTLADQQDGSFKKERERLRTVFCSFRDRAAILAEQIQNDCPGLTVHDVSHLDALWEVGSIILGEARDLTPAEGFVLGCSFLLHDLAMSVAAIPGGMSSIKKDSRWLDLLTYEYQQSEGRQPTDDELRKPARNIETRSLACLLRQLHAENAEKLAFLSFESDKGESLYLIEDTEVRQTFGRLIGQVAHSHWWKLDQVELAFSRSIGAPAWCPSEWTIDPLKIACILRASDAAHIDARRAPMFRKSLTRLDDESQKHWTFQQKLNKPYLSEDALVFTAQAFRCDEAEAWWLCLDTLQMVDRELRSIDALLADRGLSRFAARRVAGVDSPERLVSYVQTDSWLPINATVHVTDLPHVIKSLGGRELYGDRPETALRELIQNGCDAVRARRFYENRDAIFGTVNVKLEKVGTDEYQLEVRDNGIGMSKRVLTQYLLDFGKSFWGSSDMQEEFPGLLSSGLRPVGKYGIGFFSVFMIAEKVQVITRRSDGAARDTLVLEFSAGLRGRPVVRPASKQEQLLDGGTCVRLKLSTAPEQEGGLLFSRGSRKSDSLAELCPKLCPALAVDLTVTEDGKETSAVKANDWKTTNGEALLARMHLWHDRDAVPSKKELESFRKKAATCLRDLKDQNGNVIGRALVYSDSRMSARESRIWHRGVVTVAGLSSCPLYGILGVLEGTAVRASRELAIPIADESALRDWAVEQAQLIHENWPDPEYQLECAQLIRLCGGYTGPLAICEMAGKWMSADDISSISDPPNEVIIVDRLSLEWVTETLPDYQLQSNVIVTSSSGIPSILGVSRFSNDELDWPTLQKHSDADGWKRHLDLGGAVIEALAKAWGMKPEELRDEEESMEMEYEKKLTVGSFDGHPLLIGGHRILRPI